LGIKTIPLEKSLHVKFGDLDNPEGLASLETIWRLERIKYAYEIIMGIGFEHAAGHLNVTTQKATLTSSDVNEIKKAAKGILTAAQGNYAVWPKGVEGDVRDVPFQAAAALLDTIRYYGILTLATINMQWMAQGTLSPYGSYSTQVDSTNFFISWFNNMVDGIVQQVDAQLEKRLFDIAINKAAFPGMTRRPKIEIVEHVQKVVDLQELGTFMTALSAILPLTEEDILAVRRKSEFLPQSLPLL
jgi:hypothetical protein